jgi:hypothetical protein
MDKADKLTEILEDLCHNTMGNPPYRITEAHQTIQKLYEPLSEEEIEKIIFQRVEYHYQTENEDYMIGSPKKLAHAIYEAWQKKSK